MADLGNPRLVLIDSATGKPQEIPSPDVLAEISATAATDSIADFPTLMTTAAEVLSGSTGRSEVWLASDLQTSNWQPGDERWAAVRASLAALRQKPSVRVLSLTGSNAPNTSLRLLGTRRTADGLLLDLELLRSEESRSPLSLPVTTSLAGARSTDSVNLPGQSLTYQKRIKISDQGGSGYGFLSIPADGNPRDNSVFFAYGPARPVKTLIVAEAGEAADYLALAAAPPGFEKQSAERIDPAQFATTPLSESAMILWATPLPTGENAKILETFLSSGGQLVFFPPPTQSSPTSTSDFLGMKWTPPTIAEAGKFFILQDWNKSDGPSATGWTAPLFPPSAFVPSNV